MHCLAHCLNLCLQDAGRNLPLLRDALDAVKQITRLIKNSPKRAHLLAEKLAQSEVSGVTLKPLCPTRWTVRTGTIGAGLTDYTVLMETLQEVHQTTHDECGIQAAGLLTGISGLEKFSTLFGLKLGYLIFGASETLSKSLQGKDTTLQEALAAVNLAKAFYKRQRTVEAFCRFYDQVLETAEMVEIAGPELPRYRRTPARLDDGSQPHRYATPKDYFRHQYFQACDLLTRELEDRFQQRDLLPPVISLEKLLLKAANGEAYEQELEIIKTSCYKDDFNFDQLEQQLPLSVNLVQQALPDVRKLLLCVLYVKL